jgi:multidrug efflux pump subunit AcrB
MGAFFTATSMIGFMAGAGIVVRNSIILVDFIEQRCAKACRWPMPWWMRARCGSARCC